MRLFLKRFVWNSKSTNRVYIYQNRKNSNIFKIVNLWKIFYFSILWKHATSIKICSVTDNTSLINIAICTSMSICKLRYHLHFSFEFSSLTIRCWRVDKYFSSIQSSINHWIIWNPTFLTYLIRHWSIIELYNKNSDWYFCLTSNILYRLRQLEATHTSFTFPRSKLSCLKIIISISKNHFWPYSDNFVIKH